MVKPYHYVRFNWWGRVDLDEVADELVKKFSVAMARIPWDDLEVSLDNGLHEELRVKADTLNAFLSIHKVVLFQMEAEPFTARDMELRRRMMELYPRKRPTPFPFMFGREPEFEVAE